MAYFDPQYVEGAPSKEAEEIDVEIISKMKCPKGHPLQPELWHMPGGSGSSYAKSYVAWGECYICGYTKEI